MEGPAHKAIGILVVASKAEGISTRRIADSTVKIPISATRVGMKLAVSTVAQVIMARAIAGGLEAGIGRVKTRVDTKDTTRLAKAAKEIVVDKTTTQEDRTGKIKTRVTSTAVTTTLVESSKEIAGCREAIAVGLIGKIKVAAARVVMAEVAITVVKVEEVILVARAAVEIGVLEVKAMAIKAALGANRRWVSEAKAPTVKARDGTWVRKSPTVAKAQRGFVGRTKGYRKIFRRDSRTTTSSMHRTLK